MLAGADFASSPARILIDFIDPIIVAQKVATTDRNKFISVYEISKIIKEGERGIGGTRFSWKEENNCLMDFGTTWKLVKTWILR